MNATDTEHRAAVMNVSKNNNQPSNPAFHPYLKYPKPHTAARVVQLTPWDVHTLCAAYDWPTGLTGGGVIGIVELGGGWLQSDLELFCGRNNIPVPSVTDVPVDGTRNAPGVDPDSDGEVALDVQIAAAAYSTATGLPATIRVVRAKDIAPAVRAAIHDGCDVCSISWERTRRYGVTRRCGTWNRLRRRRSRPGWFCSRRPATTTCPTAVRTRPMSMPRQAART